MTPARKTTMFVHAHPDDESITTGGAIADIALSGDEAVVVTCTLGEEGEVMTDEWRWLVADEGDQLGGYRTGELAGALSALSTGRPGAVRAEFLGGTGRFRDSGMVDTPSLAHPRAFVSSGEVAVDLLGALIDRYTPDTVVTYDPSGGYGHPDHVRAHEITVEAIRRATHRVRRLAWTVTDPSALEIRHTDPPAGYRNAEPGELPSYAGANCRVELSDEAFAAKLDALRAHRTQLDVIGDERAGKWFFGLTNRVLQPVPRAEHYVVFDVDPATGDLTECEPGVRL